MFATPNARSRQIATTGSDTSKRRGALPLIMALVIVPIAWRCSAFGDDRRPPTVSVAIIARATDGDDVVLRLLCPSHRLAFDANGQARLSIRIQRLQEHDEQPTPHLADVLSHQLLLSAPAVGQSHVEITIAVDTARSPELFVPLTETPLAELVAHIEGSTQ